MSKRKKDKSESPILAVEPEAAEAAEPAGAPDIDIPNQVTDEDLHKLQVAYLERENRRLAYENAQLRLEVSQQHYQTASNELKDLNDKMLKKYAVPGHGSINLQNGAINRQPTAAVGV